MRWQGCGNWCAHRKRKGITIPLPFLPQMESRFNFKCKTCLDLYNYLDQLYLFIRRRNDSSKSRYIGVNPTADNVAAFLEENSSAPQLQIDTDLPSRKRIRAEETLFISEEQTEGKEQKGPSKKNLKECPQGDSGVNSDSDPPAQESVREDVPESPESIDCASDDDSSCEVLPEVNEHGLHAEKMNSNVDHARANVQDNTCEVLPEEKTLLHLMRGEETDQIPMTLRDLLQSLPSAGLDERGNAAFSMTDRIILLSSALVTSMVYSKLMR